MAPSATTAEFPPPSALSRSLKISPTNSKTHPTYEHPGHLVHLAQTILHNLQHQHDWTLLQIHTHSSSLHPLPRPMISGLPPKRAYIHPDEQAEIIKAEHEAGTAIEQVPEREWVLPTGVAEKWSLMRFAEVFDAIDVVPSNVPAEEGEDAEEESVGAKWRGGNRKKRLLLATLHDDSTVVYYIMHDGIVKPRQN